MNDLGVCCATAGAQGKGVDTYPDESLAPGIKDFWLASYGVIFSKTAREAAERATVGTERYRTLTGRKTLLRVCGMNTAFADAKEAYCVESNARHYAIRKPGDLGEKGDNYLVWSNHYKYGNGSFDEDNVFHPDEPMTKYCPEKEKKSSYYRFWSGMWMLQSNYGKIDREMIMRELVTSHYAYDKAGKRYDPDPDTGVPTVDDESGWTGSFCVHIGPFTKKMPLGKGGNSETTVFNLSTLEVWYVPAWPCHYKQWDMDWHYLNLKPFSEYRKRLWGY